MYLHWDSNGGQLEQFENEAAFSSSMDPVGVVSLNEFSETDAAISALSIRGVNVTPSDEIKYAAVHERTALHISAGTTTFASNSNEATFTVCNSFEDNSGDDVNKGASIDIRDSGFKAADIKYFFPKVDNPMGFLQPNMTLQIKNITYDIDDTSGKQYPNVYFKFVLN